MDTPRMYNQYQAIELALCKQIAEAIEPDYVSGLRNIVTNMIPTYIPSICNFLQTTYGRCSPMELIQKQDDVKDSIHYSLQPIDTVFDTADRFSNLYELVKDPFPDILKANLAYKVISKQNTFMDTLTRWTRKSFADKTCANMKTFMRIEHSKLEVVGGLLINNSVLNQEHILQDLKEHQTQMLAQME